MSRTEINKGILKPVDVYELCESIGLSYSCEEDMRDKLYNEDLAIEIDGQWYSVDWKIQAGDACEGFCVVEPQLNGDIHFHTMHYNGGAHWSELVGADVRDKRLVSGL